MDSANKKLVIGVDEAGYGPNLGPLLVAATVWLVPEHVTEAELAASLSEGFSCERWEEACQTVPLGDSKQLYRPGQGLVSLETGLCALLVAMDEADNCQNFRGAPDWLGDMETFLQRFGEMPQGECDLPWYRQLQALKLPSAQTSREILRLSELARQRFQALDLCLLQARVRVISEKEFNAGIEKLGSKGQLLTITTLKLVADLLEAMPRPVEIFCDRHGGRKNYLPQLMDTWPESWFQEIRSDASRCSYQNLCQPEFTIHFSVGGDSFPPTAMASMLAKYTRERFMESFNAFWSARLQDLKPTAGYPVDAQRFRRELGDAPLELGLPASLWWRSR